MVSVKVRAIGVDGGAQGLVRTCGVAGDGIRIVGTASLAHAIDSGLRLRNKREIITAMIGWQHTSHWGANRARKEYGPALKPDFCALHTSLAMVARVMLVVMCTRSLAFKMSLLYCNIYATW